MMGYTLLRLIAHQAYRGLGPLGRTKSPELLPSFSTPKTATFLGALKLQLAAGRSGDSADAQRIAAVAVLSP